MAALNSPQNNSQSLMEAASAINEKTRQKLFNFKNHEPSPLNREAAAVGATEIAYA